MILGSFTYTVTAVGELANKNLKKLGMSALNLMAEHLQNYPEIYIYMEKVCP